MCRGGHGGTEILCVASRSRDPTLPAGRADSGCRGTPHPRLRFSREKALFSEASPAPRRVGSPPAARRNFSLLGFPAPPSRPRAGTAAQAAGGAPAGPAAGRAEPLTPSGPPTPGPGPAARPPPHGSPRPVTGGGPAGPKRLFPQPRAASARPPAPRPARVDGRAAPTSSSRRRRRSR